VRGVGLSDDWMPIDQEGQLVGDAPPGNESQRVESQLGRWSNLNLEADLMPRTACFLLILQPDRLNLGDPSAEGLAVKPDRVGSLQSPAADGGFHSRTPATSQGENRQRFRVSPDLRLVGCP
jgi:hypothetical protein